MRSVKAHTREEWHSGEIVATVVDSHKPLTFLLKYTLTATSVCFKNSIEAGFGGNSLPTTIEKFNPGLANASDQVTVQEHIAAVGIRNDLSVVEFEINTVSDSGVHLAFDLAHLREENGFEVWRADRVAVPSTSLRYPILGRCARKVDTAPTGTISLYLERNRLQSRRRNRSVMIGTILNVCLCNIIHDDIKNIQDLLTSVTLTKHTKVNITIEH